MARLLPIPPGLDDYLVGWEPLSGPRTVSGKPAQEMTIGGGIQSLSSPFGAWRFRLLYGPLDGGMERAFRGWTTAMHGGANATRLPFLDPAKMTFAEAGANLTYGDIYGGLTWSNGQSWSNGVNWQQSLPILHPASAAAKDDSTFSLPDEFWGYSAGWGTFVGFLPFHFGMYMITEEQGSGVYRIWPPLRKAITTSDYCTLDPVLAVRLESEEAVTMTRNGVFLEGIAITVVEVFDYDVRTDFTD
ncbi:hypothetical protein [Hyphomonas sp. UBA4494]|jgi:hypothetical protein|uniref:hypothetical protein n=1 Tax=Hyphomonas sp. UBA4494 TaxID=1946631 RepID=UPI0025C27044|nr:hypothetical protein [Hyphomonas sp. UBA4494]